MRLEEMTDFDLDKLVHTKIFNQAVKEDWQGMTGDLPRYNQSLDLTAKMEAEIAKNIHTGQYVEELTRVLEAEWWPKYEQVSLFKLVTATPRQRVLAALKACGVEQHQPAPDGE